MRLRRLGLMSALALVCVIELLDRAHREQEERGANGLARRT